MHGGFAVGYFSASESLGDLAFLELFVSDGLVVGLFSDDGVLEVGQHLEDLVHWATGSHGGLDLSEDCSQAVSVVQGVLVEEGGGGHGCHQEDEAKNEFHFDI